ncbi:hypothetical protein N6H05_02715 [Sphingobium sp. WTD-1]|uniref:hypothetical protein n=1 Tax=Sphingobium sp. WTD-1 TaxID=2979467 RepID=UPI0024DE4AAA|nr:hypothetical protein [Sphingobium sp. WTD-1]WIA56749.1 hypothetical protein N6H05_02715 [Sphingobium sp. WTD-1]
MTILLLVLAFVACLQACRLLLALSINALPVGIAVVTAFWLNDFGHGLLFSTLLALSVGIALARTAPWLCAHCHAPAVRRTVIFLFVLPAGIAGYQGTMAICLLLMPEGAAVMASMFAGTLIGISAARHLG